MLAYLPNGTLVTGVTAGSDEDENADGDATFVTNRNIDDQLIWIPTGIRMGRMLAAGKLP